MSKYQKDKHSRASNVGLPVIELQRQRAQRIKEQQRIIRSMMENHNQQLTRYLETQKQMIDKRWKQEAITQQQEYCRLDGQLAQVNDAIEFYENCQQPNLPQLERRNSFIIDLEMRQNLFEADQAELNESLEQIPNDGNIHEQQVQSQLIKSSEEDQSGQDLQSSSLVPERHEEPSFQENKSDQQGALKYSLSGDLGSPKQDEINSILNIKEERKLDIRSSLLQALAADPQQNIQKRMLQSEEEKSGYEHSLSASSESLSARRKSSYEDYNDQQIEAKVSDSSFDIFSKQPIQYSGGQNDSGSSFNKSVSSVHSDSPQFQKSRSSSLKNIGIYKHVDPVPSSNQKHFSQIYSQFELFKYQASPQLIKLQKCKIDDAVANDQQAKNKNSSLINNVLEYPSQLQAPQLHVLNPVERGNVRRIRSAIHRSPKRSKNMVQDQRVVKDIINMRQAIKDLKRRCNSAKNKVEMVNGRKIHKMLYSIKEREENVKASMEDLEDHEDVEDESPIIGHSDNLEIKKIYQNCHKSLKEFQIGVDSKSEYILSEQKLNIQRISQKLRRMSQEDEGIIDQI